MSFSKPPARPVGNDDAAHFYQWVWDELALHGRLIDTPEIQFNYSRHGVEPVISLSHQTSQSVGMKYKGEWNSSTQCSAQEVWTRGVLGEFICVSAPPIGIAPETGSPYWHAWQYPPPGVWQ